jgi:hypothetical protein
MTIHNKIFDNSNHEYTITETKINEYQTLKFNHELGIGFLNPPENSDEIYDVDYWDRYRGMMHTEIGRNLNQCRIDIANKFKVNPLQLLDIGVGNAQFVDTFGCRGFDINPMAIEYLKSTNKYINPYTESCKWKWMSFFDSLEHIVDSSELLSKTHNAIVSVPIHQNLESLLISKHLRPSEHFWHFTVSGMLHYMNHFGFDCKYYSTIESKLGRQDIGSFVFKRD